MSPFGWAKEKLESILLPMDQELVWSIPLSSRRRPDRRRSVSTSWGVSDSSWWRKLWRSQVPNKVKIHVWRAYHDALPAMLPLSKRGIDADKLCPLCRDDMEDTSHAFWYCVDAQERRNKWTFENQMLTSIETVAWAGRFLGDFLVCNGLDKPPEKKTLALKVLWHTPSHDQIKINVDAAVDSSLERIFGKFSPQIGECLAVREGVRLAKFLGLDNWVVESDTLNTVSAIQNPVAEAPEANLVEDIRDSLLAARSGMVCYIFRDGNRVAHLLENYAISRSVYCFWG
ncbi:hypothetical protein TIFTF001_011520 [Ficus carica]|uniref:Reverse transcriptase zinc-binding domain-containing protein n=1 Tax=Ficus carica TaxID=3494 RepID=A0AA88D0T0_FICCA|nr:hypothetical protein TIFTF001_011520 [Ficus carica]